MLPRRPIRIVTLGDWSNYFSYFLAGTQEGAIHNDCLFRPIDIGLSKEKIINCLAQFRPNILFCHCIFSNNFRPQEQFEVLETVRKRFGTKVYYHLGDARTEPRYPQDISRFVDVCLVNQTGNLQKFSDIWKVPTYYWPYGCFKQKEIAVIDPKFRHNLVFTGRLASKGVHEGRSKFVQELKKVLPDLALYPNQEYPDTKLLTADIAASSKAVLGVCAGYDIEGYIDVRPFQYPGAGGFLFQRYYQGMGKLFENKKHLVWFADYDINNFLGLYGEYMGKPEAMNRIRKDGFAFCQKHHSMQVRVKSVIDLNFGLTTDTNVHRVC